MKYCPKCNSRYDFEMSFCLADGTALLTRDVVPETRIDREHSENVGTGANSAPTIVTGAGSERTLVLPLQNDRITNKTEASAEPVRGAVFFEPQKKSRIGAILAALGAIFLLIGASIGGMLYLRQAGPEVATANTAGNSNRMNRLENAGQNTNTGQAFDFNSNTVNHDLSNSNSNEKPKPTPSVENGLKPTPTAKPSESIEPGPGKTTLPTSAPTVTPTLPRVPKVVSGGVVNGKAISLVKPAYPPAARAVRASGAVNVQVLIDENGNVVSANAVSGHPLLRQSAVEAARASRFSPTLLGGQKVKVMGIIVYNFSTQ